MKIIFVCLNFLIVPLFSIAQNLPDNDFENWTPHSSTSGNVTYYEPSSGWWGTLNRLSFILLGNPITVSNTNDAHNGQYAAKLETKQAAGMIIPGLMFAGYFDANSPLTGYIVQGRPFEGKPEKLSGWYKFYQSGNDSSGILIYLTAYNTVTQSRDTIAKEEKAFYVNTDSYTYFEKEFEYFYEDKTPDSIFVIILSSLGWKNFTNASVGNTLFIDDLTLHYSSGVSENLMGEDPVIVYKTSEQILELNLPDTVSEATLELYSLQGSKLFSGCFYGEKSKRYFVGNMPAGILLFRIYSKSGFLISGKVSIF